MVSILSGLHIGDIKCTLDNFCNFLQLQPITQKWFLRKIVGEALDTDVKSTLITRGKRTLLDTGAVRFIWKKF